MKMKTNQFLVSNNTWVKNVIVKPLLSILLLVLVVSTASAQCPTGTLTGQTNFGLLHVPAGSTYTVYGNFINNGGTITNEGTINVYGGTLQHINGGTINSTGAGIVKTLSCALPTLATTTPTQTATTGQAKTGNAATELAPTGGTSPYAYSNGSGDALCVAPSGATALPASSSFTVNATTGAYSYTAPSTAGTYYYCTKVCDSKTPTPNCNVAVSTLTVGNAICAIGSAFPTLK
jgi:hypothetical protein